MFIRGWCLACGAISLATCGCQSLRGEPVTGAPPAQTIFPAPSLSSAPPPSTSDLGPFAEIYRSPTPAGAAPTYTTLPGGYSSTAPGGIAGSPPPVTHYSSPAAPSYVAPPHQSAPVYASPSAPNGFQSLGPPSGAPVYRPSIPAAAPSSTPPSSVLSPAPAGSPSAKSAPTSPWDSHSPGIIPMNHVQGAAALDFVDARPMTAIDFHDNAAPHPAPPSQSPLAALRAAAEKQRQAASRPRSEMPPAIDLTKP